MLSWSLGTQMSFNSASGFTASIQYFLPSQLYSPGPSVTLLGHTLTNWLQDNTRNILTKSTQSILIRHTTLIQCMTPPQHDFSIQIYFIILLPYLHPKQRPAACDIKWKSSRLAFLGLYHVAPVYISTWFPYTSTSKLLLIRLGPFSPRLYMQVIHYVCPSRSQLYDEKSYNLSVATTSPVRKQISHQELFTWSPREAAVCTRGVPTNDSEMAVGLCKYVHGGRQAQSSI